MNIEEIEEGNKLIAEFMGAEVTKVYNEVDGLSGLIFYYPKYTSPSIFRNLPLSAIKYHSDIAWLMPVVQKICDLNDEFVYIDEVTISKKGFTITALITNVPYSRDSKFIYFMIEGDIVNGKPFDKIDTIYYGVIEFIKWYNENKK